MCTRRAQFGPLRGVTFSAFCPEVEKPRWVHHLLCNRRSNTSIGKAAVCTNGRIQLGINPSVQTMDEIPGILMESFGRGARAATLEPVDVRAVAAVLRRVGVGVGEDVPGLALLLVRGRVHVLIRRMQYLRSAILRHRFQPCRLDNFDSIVKRSRRYHLLTSSYGNCTLVK